MHTKDQQIVVVLIIKFILQLLNASLKVKLKVVAITYASFTILLFASYKPPTVKIGPIVLRPQALHIVPKEFYIAQIADDRQGKTAVAWIFPLIMPKQKPTVQAVDLKGGGLNAIRNFIFQSLPKDKSLRPILIRLKECRVTESPAAQGRVEGKVALSLSFDLINDEENIHLTDYRIDTKYVRPYNQINVIEPALRESFNSALKYFNTWINNQADDNPKLAEAVKVVIKDYQEKLEGDTIYYNVNRPLIWKDFQEKAPSSKYAASVFPSFGFEEQREIVDGVIRLHLDIKVYVPKSACWVKDGDRTDYTLNHEQRHFDIVKIVGEHFKQKISTLKLPVSNCDGPINFEFYESFREMNHLQDQYDDETQHGINTVQQERWNKRIDQDLAVLALKKNLIYLK